MATQFVSGEAPRVTMEAIQGEIVAVNYFTAAEGALGAGTAHTPSMELLTFCVITLRNGFTVVGQSACASPGNYSKLIGEQIAFKNAFDEIWPLMGYELRSRLHRIEETDDKLGEALTRLTAHRLGNPEALRPEDVDLILDHVTDPGTE